MINKGIFGHETNFKDRFITDRKRLVELVKCWKSIGLKIVLTSGAWDLFHLGHAKYLEDAKKCGDILIVGVDSDAKIKMRKGPNRPVVNQEERIQVLSHCRHVDVLVLKNLDDPEFHLLKAVHPDVLIVSKSTKHKKDRVNKMKKFCNKTKILEPRSQSSTTAKIRLLHTGGAQKLVDKITPEIIKLINDSLKGLGDGK